MLSGTVLVSRTGDVEKTTCCDKLV